MSVVKLGHVGKPTHLSLLLRKVAGFFPPEKQHLGAPPSGCFLYLQAMRVPEGKILLLFP